VKPSNWLIASENSPALENGQQALGFHHARATADSESAWQNQK